MLAVWQLSNEELYEATGSTPVSVLIQVRRWRWIGHVLRTSPTNISRTALTWAPEGKRRRGRPRETWRRTVETERNQLGWCSWGAAIASAANRDGWRSFLAGLKSPHGPDEDKTRMLAVKDSLYHRLHSLVSYACDVFRGVDSLV